MKLDKYAIQQLAPYMTGHKEYGADFSGKELVSLFNKYGGLRDVYDNGLPIIREGSNTSRKQYVEDRLNKMADCEGLSSLIEDIINNSKLKDKCAEEFNDIIAPCGYNIDCISGEYKVSGLKVTKPLVIKNNAVFERIQNEILSTLNKAQLSIHVAVAWFTNERLYNKLLEKNNEGLDVRIIINNDGVNKTNGIDTSILDVLKIRAERGGIMHEKFCVIDNQIVISGSYNWTDNAELRNAENINITVNDNELATRYSLEFKKMWNQGKRYEKDNS